MVMWPMIHSIRLILSHFSPFKPFRSNLVTFVHSGNFGLFSLILSIWSNSVYFGLYGPLQSIQSNSVYFGPFFLYYLTTYPFIFTSFIISVNDSLISFVFFFFSFFFFCCENWLLKMTKQV